MTQTLDAKKAAENWIERFGDHVLLSEAFESAKRALQGGNRDLSHLTASERTGLDKILHNLTRIALGEVAQADTWSEIATVALIVSGEVTGWTLESENPEPVKTSRNRAAKRKR